MNNKKWSAFLYFRSLHRLNRTFWDSSEAGNLQKKISSPKIVAGVENFFSWFSLEQPKPYNWFLKVHKGKLIIFHLFIKNKAIIETYSKEVIDNRFILFFVRKFIL